MVLLLPLSAGLLVAAGGCGDGGASHPRDKPPMEQAGSLAPTGQGYRQSADDANGRAATTTPDPVPQQLAETVAGLGMNDVDRPKTAATLTECVKRWNGPANESGRRAAVAAVARPDGAIVQIGNESDYFDAAGRCVIWIVSNGPPSVADVLGELGSGSFLPIGGASHLLTAPDYAVDANARILAP